MRYISLIFIITIMIISGCSGDSGMQPVADISAGVNRESGTSESHTLLGYWQGRIDPAAKTIEFTPLRETALHLNALPFLEPPVNLYLTVESVQFYGSMVIADIGLRHPFTTLAQFTGFDVCGIFIANGSTAGFADPDLRMSGSGDTRIHNPDGYTRWWNPVEFPVNAGSMFSYTDGLLGTPDASANFNATLNGYKYFCDDLDNVDDTLADVTQTNRGLFTPGKKNVRQYIIELGQGLIFNYAVDASWQFPTGDPPYTAPDDFGPNANRPEAWNISVTEVSNTLWNNGTSNGGGLNLSIDVYDWFNPQLNTVRVESPGNFTMLESSAPSGGGVGYSTYNIEIPSATPEPDYIKMLISVGSDKTGYGGLLPGKPVTSYFTYSTLVDNQEPPVTGGWARTWGAGSQDRGYACATDSQGNIYVGGDYYYAVDFDPGPGTDIQPSPGNRSSFFSKFNSAGEYQWARTWGDNVSFGGGVTDLEVDGNDNIVISGHFYGTIDFDTGPGEDIHTSVTDSTQDDGGDAYVTKFDSNGNHMWAETWGGPDWLGDAALGVTVDDAGNVYLTGGFIGPVDFDTGPGEDILESQGGYRDVFINKYSADGVYQWAKYFGGPYDDYAYGVGIDKVGDFYVCGRYYGDCDFDPGVGEDWYNSAIDGNMFLSKFDADGVYIRSRIFGNGDLFRISFDSQNNVYVSGGFSGVSQFDPIGGAGSVTSNGTRDAFINKFDANGNWQWVKTWDSIHTGDWTSGYLGYHMYIDNNDDIYATGHFTQTADLDPDPVGVDEHISNGDRDAYVSKFTPDGDHIWSVTFGGTTVDDGGGIAVDENTGYVYTTGWWGETVDFDPTAGEDIHVSNGSLDVFLLQLSPGGSW